MSLLYHSDHSGETLHQSIQFLTALAGTGGMFRRNGWNGTVIWSARGFDKCHVSGDRYLNPEPHPLECLGANGLCGHTISIKSARLGIPFPQSLLFLPCTPLHQRNLLIPLTVGYNGKRREGLWVALPHLCSSYATDVHLPWVLQLPPPTGSSLS